MRIEFNDYKISAQELAQMFVDSGSDEGQPLQIYFNPIEAFVSGHAYINSFDEHGHIVKTYKFVDIEYTDNF